MRSSSRASASWRLAPSIACCCLLRCRADALQLPRVRLLALGPLYRLLLPPALSLRLHLLDLQVPELLQGGRQRRQHTTHLAVQAHDEGAARHELLAGVEPLGVSALLGREPDLAGVLDAPGALPDVGELYRSHLLAL